jgi:hypothetical protein
VVVDHAAAAEEVGMKVAAVGADMKAVVVAVDGTNL